MRCYDCSTINGETRPYCDACITDFRNTIARLTRERDEARAEVERLRSRKCVHDLAGEFLRDAIEAGEHDK